MKIILIIAFIFNLSLSAVAHDRMIVTIKKTDGTNLLCQIETYNGKIINNRILKILVNGAKSEIDRNDVNEIISENIKYEIIEHNIQSAGPQTSTNTVKKLAELQIVGNVKLYGVYNKKTTVTSAPNGYVSSTAFYLDVDYFLVSTETAFIGKTNFKSTIKNPFLNVNHFWLK